MASSTANSILYDKKLLNVKDIYALQIEHLTQLVMYTSNEEKELSELTEITLSNLQQEYWTTKCIGENPEILRFGKKCHLADALIILKNHNITICNHQNIEIINVTHRIKGDQITTIDKKNIQKWTHFLENNNLSRKGIEPKWYKEVIKEACIDQENREIKPAILYRLNGINYVKLENLKTKEDIKSNKKKLISWNDTHTRFGILKNESSNMETEEGLFDFVRNKLTLIEYILKNNKKSNEIIKILENSQQSFTLERRFRVKCVAITKKSRTNYDNKLISFISIELYPIQKNKSKWIIQGKIQNCEDRDKAYWLMLIFTTAILPKDTETIFNIDKRVWDKLREWMMLSSRRQLNDKYYVLLKFLTELKFVHNEIWTRESEDECNLEDVDINEILKEKEKELTNIEEKLDDIEFIFENLLIDKYNIRWMENIIEGQYRMLAKKLNAITYKAEFINTSSMKDIMDNNLHALIHWQSTYDIINDKINYTTKKTCKDNDANIIFRYKNFTKQLPTYEICFERQVYGVKNKKCIRCNADDETWDHIWICPKNNTTIEKIRDEAIDEIISEITDKSNEQYTQIVTKKQHNNNRKKYNIKNSR
ncbi:hypothetical protein RclHR1_35780001 [Rhizophagus clarus]|uniref:Uncharacterized protein n=1 Tax=Rhizophagus clarus TaxID=94130 RepID=A0A2Z6RF17_9GLOM|nr:hypothetical protein RclHR1_35780001 [Rhizophagus clarus]